MDGCRDAHRDVPVSLSERKCSVTLEVGATYQHARTIFPNITWTVIAVGERTWYGRSSEGVENIFVLDDAWVRVIPTPAGRWHVYDRDGALWGVYHSLQAAQEQASAKPGRRVARFSFAGWVDPQDTPTKDAT